VKTDADGTHRYLCEACEEGDLPMARWLATTFDYKAEDVRALAVLPRVCARGRLQVARWCVATFGLTADDARAQNNRALGQTCAQGHLAVAEWLVETFALGIEDARQAHALSRACCGGHPETVRWLVRLYDGLSDDLDAAALMELLRSHDRNAESWLRDVLNW
jgi:hypothetical protein